MFETPPTTALTKKAEATPGRILEVALYLFRRTTMRGIAAKAGVSLGSAYYYFDSKEDLVMTFSEQAIEARAPKMEAALAGKTSFEERIAAILEVKFEYFQPNRSFLGCPVPARCRLAERSVTFQRGDSPIPECDQTYFARAIATKSGGVRVPEDLAQFMPKILWLYQMGLILHRIYDHSPDQRRTHALCEKGLAFLVSSLKLSSFALAKPLRSKIVELIALWKEGKTVPDHKLIRLSIAMVWFYQGLWCKVLGGVPRQEAVISTAPFICAAEVRLALTTLGLVECGLAVWVLSGQRMRQAATVQTALLAAMNSGGLIWAWHLIPDPVGMIVQNFAFLVLVWIASEDRRYAAHT